MITSLAMLLASACVLEPPSGVTVEPTKDTYRVCVQTRAGRRCEAGVTLPGPCAQQQRALEAVARTWRLMATLRASPNEAKRPEKKVKGAPRPSVTPESRDPSETDPNNTNEKNEKNVQSAEAETAPVDEEPAPGSLPREFVVAPKPGSLMRPIAPTAAAPTWTDADPSGRTSSTLPSVATPTAVRRSRPPEKLDAYLLQSRLLTRPPKPAWYARWQSWAQLGVAAASGLGATALVTQGDGWTADTMAFGLAVIGTALATNAFVVD